MAMRVPPRWRTFSSYLRERFGGRVWKLPLDAGFTCPNRDGTCGTKGCAYCSNAAFSPYAARRAPNGTPVPLETQLDEGAARARRRGAARFMAYLQAYSSTYGAPARLAQLYDTVASYPGVVALAVGTRPDCLDARVLDLLSAYARRMEVWIELGLQSIHDATLRDMGRGHTAADFFAAAAACRERPLKLCVHVILGLPGESMAHTAATADALAQITLHGLKLHPLQIIDGTPLAARRAREGLALWTRDDYVAGAADFLERTPPDVVIQRLAADALGETLVAPDWARRSGDVAADIAAELARRGTRQGSRARS